MLVFRREFWHISAYWSSIEKMHPLSEPDQVRETFDFRNISPCGKFPDKSCPVLWCILVIFLEYTKKFSHAVDYELKFMKILFGVTFISF